MLSELKCSKCGCQFVVALTEIKPEYAMRYCVACGARELDFKGMINEEQKGGKMEAPKLRQEVKHG